MASKDSGIKLRYFFLFFFLVIILLFLFIIKPFFGSVFLGVITAFAFLPLHNILGKHIKNKNVCALLMTMIVIILFALPLIFLGNMLIKETYSTYIFVSQKIDLDNLSSDDGLLAYMPDVITKTFLNQRFIRYFETGIANLANSIISSISSFLLSLPSLLLNIFFYFSY